MLDSSKISLRKVKPSDAETILKWENNTHHWEVTNTKEPYSRNDIENFVNQEQDIVLNNQLRLMICYNDISVGCVDLFDYEAEKQKAGVGVLIEEQFRNKGFARRALSLLEVYCRNELNIVHLFCNIQINNTASIRLFEKSGFNFIYEAELYGKKVNYYEKQC